MSSVKILVAENELLTAEMIAATLNDAGYEICAQISNGEHLQAAVQDTVPDLLIMDIGLNGKLDGIEAVKALNGIRLPVIYLTDIDDRQTISRAEQTNPSAYLVKPFNDRQLLASIHMALHNFSTGKQAGGNNGDEIEADSPVLINEVMYIKIKSGLFEKILADEICFIKACGNYTEIQMTGGRCYTLTSSMSQVTRQLTHPQFVKVHRSFTVNINRIDTVKGNLLVAGGHEIPVGESYRPEVMNMFPYLK